MTKISYVTLTRLTETRNCRAKTELRTASSIPLDHIPFVSKRQPTSLQVLRSPAVVERVPREDGLLALWGWTAQYIETRSISEVIFESPVVTFLHLCHLDWGLEGSFACSAAAVPFLRVGPPIN